jgi:aerobic carbon-monoxide dehydrogenase medium subunit
MKPAPFTYFAPETLDEALALRAEHAGDCVVLSGGQSLLPILHLRLAQPAVVIDVNRIPGLGEIAERNGGLSIGARTRQREAERSSLVAERAPLLARSLPLIAHPAIRSRGTIGGSIAHADPAAELPAVVLALDAELVVQSKARGERSIPASEFFHGFLSTALESDEILTEIRLAAPLANSGVAFLEVARNHGAFAIVGAAAVVQVNGGTVGETRLVFTGAGGTAIRARGAEAALVGQPATEASFAAAAEAAVADLDPVSDVHASADYRRRVARVLARRALAEAAEVAA